MLGLFLCQKGTLVEKQYESRNTPAYKHVIGEIVAQVTKGTRPYENPWRGAAGSPWNGHSGRRYSGINELILWSVAIDRGYDCHRWLTERQAAAKGGHLPEWEIGRGTKIYFGRRQHYGEGLSKGFYREYRVYSWVQFEGLQPLRTQPPEPKMAALSRFQALVAATGADIRYAGQYAFFKSQDDFIQLPVPWALYFPANDLPRILAHELGHWCIHPSRLNLQILGEHALMRRAYEEIIAELVAAFICWHFQIQPSVRSADYIADWLFGTHEKYGHRPSVAEAVFHVAQDAMRVADYLLSFGPGP